MTRRPDGDGEPQDTRRFNRVLTARKRSDFEVRRDSRERLLHSITTVDQTLGSRLINFEGDDFDGC